MDNETRIFNGKKYTFMYYKHTKPEAEKAAKEERKAGWNIRVVRRNIGGRIYYELYGRYTKH